MDSKIKRIRCFNCKKLVNITFDENDPDAPYSVIKFCVQRKRGCVCSECIENAKDDEYYSKTFYFTMGTVDDTKDSYDTSTHDKSLPPSADEEQRQLKRITEKYKCLDASLDSMCYQVKKIVYGQDETVQELMYTLYYNQYVNLVDEVEPTPLKKKNIVIIGNTGTGKTYLTTNAVKCFGIPYSISNATAITSAGYIGDKVENILERLVRETNGDIEKAQNGIIIIDEFDKKRASTDTNSRDINGISVQQELLKLLEPSIVWIKKYSNESGNAHETIPFYTGDLTVILLGAFVGLDDIIQKRIHKKAIGFSSSIPSKDDISKAEVTPDDLIEFGFIPEIVGRINTICKLNKLSLDALRDIIYKQLSDINILFKTKGFDLYFDPLLVEKIALQAFNSSTGARDIELKIKKVIDPALYRIFQSPFGGICEIDENGSANVLFKSPKNQHEIKFVTTPPIHEYVDSDDEQFAES